MVMVTRTDGAHDPVLDGVVKQTIIDAQKSTPEGMKLPPLTVGSGFSITPDAQKSNAGVYLIIAVIFFIVFSKGVKNVILK